MWKFLANIQNKNEKKEGFILDNWMDWEHFLVDGKINITLIDLAKLDLGDEKQKNKNKITKW